MQAVLVHYDTDLYDLMVKTARGTEVINTTSNHLFWDPARHQWVKAASLKRGEHLLTANGTPAVANGGHTPAATTAGCGTSPSKTTTTSTSNQPAAQVGMSIVQGPKSRLSLSTTAGRVKNSVLTALATPIKALPDLEAAGKVRDDFREWLLKRRGQVGSAMVSR